MATMLPISSMARVLGTASVDDCTCRVILPEVNV